MRSHACRTFRWWCVTNAPADHNLSRRHSNAIDFENDRITFLKFAPRTETNATGIPRHRTADARNGIGTVVIRSVCFHANWVKWIG